MSRSVGYLMLIEYVLIVTKWRHLAKHSENNAGIYSQSHQLGAYVTSDLQR